MYIDETFLWKTARPMPYLVFICGWPAVEFLRVAASHQLEDDPRPPPPSAHSPKPTSSTIPPIICNISRRQSDRR